MTTPYTKRNLRDWHQEGGKALQSMPGFSNLPLYPASYFGPFSNFLGDMDRMFEHAWRNFGAPATMGMTSMGLNMFHPKVDIIAHDKEYVVTAELPGLEEKDVRLQMSEGLLTLSGEKRQESKDNRRNAQCLECSYGSFERTLSLPDDIDQENIEARFKNGVLTITCPRTGAAEQSRTREIPISGSSESGRSRDHNRETSSSNVHSANPKKAA